MLKALKSIVFDTIRWRGQIGRLAVFELQKTVRGAVLSWFWLFVKPLTYIGVFWFVLEIGLRADDTIGDYPFILWLASGLIPWFYMSDLIGTGSNVYKRYSYLINRVSFPASVIPSFYSVSHLIIFGISLGILIVMMLIFGFPLTLYALQLPLLILLMVVFFLFFSLMTSPLSAISKDFANLMNAFGLPIFWLSGVIFNIDSITIPWVKWLFVFNPVSFLVSSFRAALCEHYWIWERPEYLWGFGIVFLLTFILALVIHSRFEKVVADAL
jgi:teichoic acid transport system permease protein